jgi:N-acetylmuramoyl-L-alanine amidase
MLVDVADGELLEIAPEAGAVAVEQMPYASEGLPPVVWYQDALVAQGYRVPRHGHLDAETRNVIAAFQMKYRPARFDGEPDAETAAMLQVLANQAKR